MQISGIKGAVHLDPYTYAEYLLSPPIPESPEKAEGGAVGGMSAEEWEFRKQELELRKEEL